MITKKEILALLTRELTDQAQRQRGGSRRSVSLLEYNEATGDLRSYASKLPGDPAHVMPNKGYYCVGGLSYHHGISVKTQAAEATAHLVECWFHDAK